MYAPYLENLTLSTPEAFTKAIDLSGLDSESSSIETQQRQQQGMLPTISWLSAKPSLWWPHSTSFTQMSMWS